MNRWPGAKAAGMKASVKVSSCLPVLGPDALSDLSLIDRTVS